MRDTTDVMGKYRKGALGALPDPELINSLLSIKGDVRGMMPMPNKLPKFLDNHKICIICEGNEEYEYLKRLKDLKVWNKQYAISLVNAGGNGNIQASVNLESNDFVTGSSNFGKYIKLFESDDSGWIEEINRKLEE